jgi:hypothetical protein
LSIGIKILQPYNFSEEQMKLFDVSRRTLLTKMAAAPTLLAAGAAPALAQISACTAAAQQAQAALKDAKGTKLVLLGTAAGPMPGRTREMTSHVMLSNGAAYVLDCGLGCTDQYARTGIPFRALRSIFITHHHPDHNIEYGPLLIIGWVQGMPTDVRAFGPPPLKQMTEDFMQAYKQTVDFWAEDFKMKPFTSVNVEEVSEAGPVTQDDNVKVSAVIVNHPPVKPVAGASCGIFQGRDRGRKGFNGSVTQAGKCRCRVNRDRSLRAENRAMIAVGTRVTSRPPGRRRRSPASGSHRT